MWDNYKRYNIYILGVPEREKKEGIETIIFEALRTANFPPNHVRKQPTDPEKIYPNRIITQKLYVSISFSNFKKSKIEKKTLKEAKKEK